MIANTSNAAFRQRDVATAHGDRRIGFDVKRQGVANFEIHQLPQGQLRFKQHRVDGNIGLRDLAGEMALPDRIAAELFADEHLQQHVADRFDCRVWQQNLYGTAAILLLLGILVLAAPDAVPGLTIPAPMAMPA